MLLRDFIIELGDRLKVDKLTSEGKNILTRKINQTYKEVARASDWEILKRTSELRTVANYTAGTVTVTIDSRTVTGSGTTWTAAMQGRYFRPGGSQNWYKIARFVSATEITLATPIIEATASGIAYTIWQRYYYLQSDVRKILSIHSWYADGELPDKSNYYIEEFTSNPSNTGRPEIFSSYGVDPYEPSYSTGTVTVTVDSTVLNGTSTVWLDNVTSGDEIEIGDRIYRVERVESDTRIIMNNAALETISSDSPAAYTITRDNAIGIQLYPAPDAVYIFPYTYQKRVYDLVNEDNDRPELPEDFDLAILDGAEASRMRDLSDIKWMAKMEEYKGRIVDLRRTMSTTKPRFKQLRPKIVSRSGY